MGPAPTYKRMLAKVTLAYPEIWRKPVTWYFNNADTMVLIPAGDFEMGSNYKEAREDEKPEHTVYLDAFYIDKYEVTVGQYKQFIQATGHRAPDWDEGSEISPTDQHPIIHVSWHDALAYAKWVDKRLPTEAEWEKAARGGIVGTKYTWGDAIPNGTQCNFADKNLAQIWNVDRIKEMIEDNTKKKINVDWLKEEIKKKVDVDWMDENSDDGYGGAAPVGSFPPNGSSLHDMAGNVWEWCLDAYQADFYSSSPRRNPIAGANSVTTMINRFRNKNLTNDSRVLRGDSFVNSAGGVGVAHRVDSASTGADNALGFRCVRSVTP